jgi:hypothetical protein
MSDWKSGSESKTDRLSEFRIDLFDSDGLPWTSRLSWGWLLFLSLTTGFLFAILLGIYLGLWLRSKGRSAFVLLLYLALAALFAALFLPDRFALQWLADVIGLSAPNCGSLEPSRFGTK